MALYTYKAIDANGKTVLGRVDAANPFDLEQRLSRMGLDLISGAPTSQKSRLVAGARIPRQGRGELGADTPDQDRLRAARLLVAREVDDARRQLLAAAREEGDARGRPRTRGGARRHPRRAAVRGDLERRAPRALAVLDPTVATAAPTADIYSVQSPALRTAMPVAAVSPSMPAFSASLNPVVFRMWSTEVFVHGNG